METYYRHWKLEHPAEPGIAWLRLDQADSSVNVLSGPVIDELNKILEMLASDPPPTLIIESAKPTGFIAGADVHAFEHIENADQALALVRKGQALMQRLESLRCIKIALIHGHCLGGGLELAMACDYRIASTDPSTKLGLPEVRLGIHPGYGGVMRSIRLIGPLAAMDLMLSGRTLAAKQARALGLIDAACPKWQLHNAAQNFAARKPPRRKSGLIARLLSKSPLRQLVAMELERRVKKIAKPEHYPAPYGLIDLWRNHGDDEQRLLEQEGHSVAKLAGTDTAKNLLRVFLLQEKLKNRVSKGHFKRLHVIGAGAMGADIALWCARQGLTVSLQDTDADRLGKALSKARLLLKKGRSSDLEIAAILDRLIPDLHGDGLSTADIVIEAIPEIAQAKIALYRSIEPRMKPDAILATNTSSLPLAELAAALAHPERFLAIHFFNPVAKLPLVEIAASSGTSVAINQAAQSFVRQIGKLALPVRDQPGFLVNRILMPYLLEAALMAEEGIGLAAIDRAALAFGMPVGPIALADQIGLDICLSVANGFGKTLGFETPAILSEKVKSGKLGKKSGEGFYRYRNGKPEKPQSSRVTTPNPQALQDRLILSLLNAAIACHRQGIVENADLLDAGAIFGAGFAPFRGGPMRYIERTGASKLLDRLKPLHSQLGPRFTPDEGWKPKP